MSSTARNHGLAATAMTTVLTVAIGLLSFGLAGNGFSANADEPTPTSTTTTTTTTVSPSSSDTATVTPSVTPTPTDSVTPSIPASTTPPATPTPTTSSAPPVILPTVRFDRITAYVGQSRKLHLEANDTSNSGKGVYICGVGSSKPGILFSLELYNNRLAASFRRAGIFPIWYYLTEYGNSCDDPKLRAIGKGTIIVLKPHKLHMRLLHGRHAVRLRNTNGARVMYQWTKLVNPDRLRQINVPPHSIRVVRLGYKQLRWTQILFAPSPVELGTGKIFFKR